MISGGKVLIVGMLALFLALSPGSVFAISADELLQQLEEEKVLSPEKAKKIKERGKEVDKKEAKDKWKVKWSNGLSIESGDKQHKIGIGGRIHLDFTNISSADGTYVSILRANEGSNVFTGTGAEFRRARIHIDGKVYNYVIFKAEYDFAGGEAAFKDVYVGLTDLPGIGTIRVGHQKEPFSLEELTSSRFITFMERALPNAFSPERNTGIMAFNTAGEKKRLWWGAGVFLDADDFGDSFQNWQRWNATVRLGYTPLYEDDGRRMFFIGMAYSHQFRNDFNFQQRYRARPEAHITDVRTVNTGNFFCQDVNLLNPQMALVFGPFSLQAEYIAALTNAPQSSTQNLNTLGLAFEGSPSFSGAYAYISYFLTGEHRPFKLDSAAFDRVKPNNNFNIANGTWGAVEVAARWSYLALNSAGLGGGIQNDATFGVNWYLTPNFRWMFNYVYVAADKRRDTRFNRTIYARFGGDAHIVQTRFAIDF